MQINLAIPHYNAPAALRSLLAQSVTQNFDRQVDWVAEGSFALRVDDFQRIGGYDTEFRYHEGQDLAHRLREANVKIFATSSIVCTHLDIEVRGKSRQREIEQSARLFYKKHHIKL